MRTLLLPTLVVAAAIAACTSHGAGDGTGESAVTSSPVLTKPWDFLYVYPEVETAADAAALPSLAELGLGREFFDRAYGYMSGKAIPAGAAPDDAPVSPDDPVVIHEECLRDPGAWHVTQVRFAPYEVAVPGTVSAYDHWARGKGSSLDRFIEVRLSVHPFCENEHIPGVVRREDQAMHLVYTAAPSDPSLTAAVFDSAAAFTAKQATGDKPGSYVELEKHRAALASPAWSAFRASVLGDWASLAATASVAADAFAPLDEVATSYRTSLVAPFDDRLTNPDPTKVDPTVAHPGLASPSAPLRVALREKIAKYARPERLKRAALMFTVGSQDPLDDFQQTRWFFSQLVPVRSASGATTFEASLLDTFVAVESAGGVDVTRATTAGYFSESRGAVSGPTDVFPSALKSEAAKVDYTSPVTLDPDDVDMPKLPSGSELEAAMRRFSDPAVVNATTTGCDRCHDMQNFLREKTANGYRAQSRSESAYDFHMITAGGLNLRTVRELDAELAKARAELR